MPTGVDFSFLFFLLSAAGLLSESTIISASRGPKILLHDIIQSADSVRACVQTVLQYSAEQEQDLMHLRRLFYGKIGQLCRERIALLKQMGSDQELVVGIGLDDVSVRLSEVSDLAQRLQANGADEYRTYMQFTSAVLRGVSLANLQFTSAFLQGVPSANLPLKSLMRTSMLFTLCWPLCNVQKFVDRQCTCVHTHAEVIGL